MTETSNRTVIHDTFVIERIFKAPPAKVFRAFSDPAEKWKWFGRPPEGWRPEVQTMDFRVGGKEISDGGPVGGPTILYEAVFHDIVPDERIITSYVMWVAPQDANQALWERYAATGDPGAREQLILQGRRISVSQATVEVLPVEGGTRLILTEQGAYFDGPEAATGRQQGFADMVDALGRSLE